MITNVFGTKHPKKRTRRKNKDQKQSLFCLDESETATLAKNHLLSQTIWNQAMKSQQFWTQNYKKKHQFNNTFDSWHGQRNLTLKQIDTGIIQKFAKPLQRTTQRITISAESNRKGIKSADLKRSYKKVETPIRKKSQIINKTAITLKNRLANIIPKFQSHKSFRSIKQVNSFPRRHQSTKSSILDFNYDHNRKAIESKVDEQNEHNDEKIRKNFMLSSNLLELKQKKLKGVPGSILKHKRNKKISWVQKNNSNNQTKLQKFRNANSPINKEINKIIDLLQSQNNFNSFDRS